MKSKVIAEDMISTFEGVDHENPWVNKEILNAALEGVVSTLEEDIVLAQKRLSFMFSNNCDSKDHTPEVAQLMHDWHAGNDLFSATAIVVRSLEELGFDSEHHKDLIRSMISASILAEVKCDLPYHNNLHFRKVLLHVVHMIAAHNLIFEDTSNILIHDEMAKLIIAACIHDIGHEGTGNFIDRKYHMAMIEKRSFLHAYPYLKASGLDEVLLSDIRVMLIATDASPFGDPISPVYQMRMAYDNHFGMSEEHVNEDDFEFSEDLQVLAEGARLSLLCVMLHEADIFNSAGVDYDVTRYESVSISKEYGLSHALPEDTLLFLETICRGRMVSGAARCIAGANLEKIRARVMDDYRNGNKSYL